MILTAAGGNPLRGEAFLPGDKSLSHRAALFAVLAQGESRLENFLVSGVTDAMLRALTALGVPWKLEGSTLRVTGSGLRGLRSPVSPIDCGNSATTIRLLAGALAASGVAAILDGSAGLRRRPMGRIVVPLVEMGVPVEAAPEGGAPLRLAARPLGQALRGLRYQQPVASAQVKTCLLLAGLAADGPLILSEPALSRDHSERMLRFMGVTIERMQEGELASVKLVPPTAPLAPLHMVIPGDFSAAAFLIVAALVTPGSAITLRGVGLNPTRTGLLETLREMGGQIDVRNLHEQSGEPAGDLSVCASSLTGVEVGGSRVVEMIDEFPIFAVAAACARGQTVVRQAEELRYKESDRITALCQELRTQGAQVTETPDGFIIEGAGRLPGGERVDAHGDHRLAMSLAVAGLAAERPVTISHAEICGESFPGFAGTLQALGAHLETQED